MRQTTVLFRLTPQYLYPRALLLFDREIVGLGLLRQQFWAKYDVIDDNMVSVRKEASDDKSGGNLWWDKWNKKAQMAAESWGQTGSNHNLKERSCSPMQGVMFCCSGVHTVIILIFPQSPIRWAANHVLLTRFETKWYIINHINIDIVAILWERKQHDSQIYFLQQHDLDVFLFIQPSRLTLTPSFLLPAAPLIPLLGGSRCFFFYLCLSSSEEYYLRCTSRLSQPRQLTLHSWESFLYPTNIFHARHNEKEFVDFWAWSPFPVGFVKFLSLFVLSVNVMYFNQKDWVC